jgi:hypothetical protein
VLIAGFFDHLEEIQCRAYVLVQFKQIMVICAESNKENCLALWHNGYDEQMWFESELCGGGADWPSKEELGWTDHELQEMARLGHKALRALAYFHLALLILGNLTSFFKPEW